MRGWSILRAAFVCLPCPPSPLRAVPALCCAGSGPGRRAPGRDALPPSVPHIAPRDRAGSEPHPLPAPEGPAGFGWFWGALSFSTAPFRARTFPPRHTPLMRMLLTKGLDRAGFVVAQLSSSFCVSSSACLLGRLIFQSSASCRELGFHMVFSSLHFSSFHGFLSVFYMPRVTSKRK